MELRHDPCEPPCFSEKWNLETRPSGLPLTCYIVGVTKQINNVPCAVPQINDVTMQVNQIATAAEEQTATTSEISSNMLQITDVVQRTSHGAHESATAAAQLSGNAEELQGLVRQFKL